MVIYIYNCKLKIKFLAAVSILLSHLGQRLSYQVEQVEDISITGTAGPSTVSPAVGTAWKHVQRAAYVVLGTSSAWHPHSPSSCA